MSKAEYEAATAPGSLEVVTYHATKCDAVKTLGFNLCDCGALALHLTRRESKADVPRASKGEKEP